MKKLILTLLAAAGLVLGAGAAVTATVLVPADLSELVQSAQAIAQGRVVAVQPQWAEGRARIETLVVVAVDQYLKGSFGPTVTLRVPGGELGRYRSVMPGAPTFREGDEVILFLGAHGPSIPFLVGLGQGVFRLARDPDTGRRVVVPSPLVGSDVRVTVVRGDPARRPMPVEDFARAVRSVASGDDAPERTSRARRTNGR
jgi:HAMP domain-containing protein